MKIDINLFLTELSELGIDADKVNISNLDSVERLAESNLVMVKVNLINNPSEEDINLIYGLSRENQYDLVLLLSNPDNKLVGAILPDDLSDLRITYEAPEAKAKDLGSGSFSTWPPYTKPVIYCCEKNARHPRFAYLQRGAEKPDKCPVCKGNMVHVKA